MKISIRTRSQNAFRLPQLYGQGNEITRKNLRQLAKPTNNPELSQLQFDHWHWNICGGDGDGSDIFAFFNDECAKQEDVPVGSFFIAGALNDERMCNVGKGDTVFIPVVNTIWWAAPGLAGDVNCARLKREQCAAKLLRAVRKIGFELERATFDGEDISDQILDLSGTTLEWGSDCPDDFAAVGVPTSDEFVWAARGLWFVIPPLKPGTHIISLAGNNGDGFSLDFEIKLI